MFDVCAKGDTAHIDTIFKLLPHMRQYADVCVASTWQELEYRINVCCVTLGAHIEHL